MKKHVALSALALAVPLLLVFRHGAQASPEKVDAVTAASLTVAAGSITATSAVIQYSKDKYDYGTRTLCYDPAPAAPKNNCTTKNARGNEGSFTVTGLKPATKYNYIITAVDTREGEKPYNTTGNFTTLASTAIAKPGARLGGASAAPAPRADLNGRRIPDAGAGAKARITLPAR